MSSVPTTGSVTSMLRFGAAMLAGPFSLQALQSNGLPGSVTTVCNPPWRGFWIVLVAVAVVNAVATVGAGE